MSRAHDPDIAAKIAQMRHTSEALVSAEEISALPEDQTRGSDANALLKHGKSPMELLTLDMWGIIELTKEQRDSAKTLMAYYHKQQTTSAKVEINGDAQQASFAAALRELSAKELSVVEQLAETPQEVRH